MHILDQAIEEKLYENAALTLKKATWADFERECEHSTLYLFGSGEGAEFVLQRYGKKIKIAGVVDNDNEKWGKELNSYISSQVDENIKIYSPSIFRGIANNCVVLITSVRYCNEIYDQLQQMNFYRVYSLLHMEANRRQQVGEQLKENEESEQINYSKKCMSLPICDNKILLARDGLAGHGKQILLRLAEIHPELDLVWVTEKKTDEYIPGIRIIAQKDWMTYVEELETSKIWIFGDMIPEYAIKRPEQVYIQVKHWSSITLKSFYFHLKRHLEIKSIYQYYRHNTDAMDYCMVGSDFDENTCRSGFDFDGKFVRVGSPRSDVLFQDGVREIVYEKIGIEPDIHTVLFAPTFRSVNSNSLIGHMRDVDLDFELVQESFEKCFGGEWRILLRIHPDVAMESKKVKKSRNVYDVSQYPDSQELVAACDVMISDYSSIMFEPAFVGKPVFLFAPDAEDYINNDRELLIDYFELPFPIAKTNTELVNNIYSFDAMDYRSRVTEFLQKYGIHEDGHASERAANFIFSIL